jgi:hypothetical protein
MNPLLSVMTRYFRRSNRDRGRIRMSRRKARRARPCLEPLESRDVPSAISVADTSAVEGRLLRAYSCPFVDECNISKNP